MRNPTLDNYDETVDLVEFQFSGTGEDLDPTRREFLQVLGAGLFISVAAGSAPAFQDPRGRRRGGGSQGAPSIAARLHIGEDGKITVMTGKVECGQGARAELSQAAAEELGMGVDAITMILADTAITPDDGGTFGSRSTPSTVPAIRKGCAAARELLRKTAAKRWSVDASEVSIKDGKAVDAQNNRTFSYADLATDAEASRSLRAPAPNDVDLTPVDAWKTLGMAIPRPNALDIVTGKHEYPSDVKRPGMLYGKVLRQPSYGAMLKDVDPSPARSMDGVVVVRDGDFVGVAAPTRAQAEKAMQAIAATATWESAPHPSSATLSAYLRDQARGGVPQNPFADVVDSAAKSLGQTYDVAYVQHAPMEPRAAVAEWSDGKVTVWTGTQNPFAVKGELVRAFVLSDDAARVIIPDFGGGFGGKHSGECAVEAARLAQAAGKPVSLVWTREEEFTWAQFRPAAVIDAEASLDADGNLSSWWFVNINSGANEIQTPYRVGKSRGQFVASEPPLRHGSYRALATTANNFGRECFMDEMAALAGRDPLEFRLAHLEPGRLRDVLAEAGQRFDWASRSGKKVENQGVGLACGIDKGSFVAACVAVTVDREAGEIRVDHVCQTYDCGKILNPANLLNQVQGAIIMGLGPALREAMRFEDGKMQNTTFGQYRVPRFADVPTLDIHLIDRPDTLSAGAGETPLIAVAPAIANAVFAATGQRVRTMPIRLPKA